MRPPLLARHGPIVALALAWLAARGYTVTAIMSDRTYGPIEVLVRGPAEAPRIRSR